MLLALDTGRARWWVVYAVAACAAFYSHYTCVFVLGVQFVWVLWAHPEARRAAVIATAAAAAGVLPWLPGLINDLPVADGQDPLRAVAVHVPATSGSTSRTGRSATRRRSPAD